MNNLTLSELADLSTALTIAEFQLRQMYHGKDRFLGIKILRRAYSTYRRLRDRTFAETSKKELERQVELMRIR